MARIRIEKNTAIIEEGDDSFVAKMMAGVQGKITLKSRHVKGGSLEITSVQDGRGKELKVPKTDKPEKEK